MFRWVRTIFLNFSLISTPIVNSNTQSVSFHYVAERKNYNNEIDITEQKNVKSRIKQKNWHACAHIKNFGFHHGYDSTHKTIQIEVVRCFFYCDYDEKKSILRCHSNQIKWNEMWRMGNANASLCVCVCVRAKAHSIQNNERSLFYWNCVWLCGIVHLYLVFN